MGALDNIDFNKYIPVFHEAAKPYIIKGLKAGILAISKKTEESNTVLDNLLWGDVIEAFQE